MRILVTDQRGVANCPLLLLKHQAKLYKHPKGRFSVLPIFSLRLKPQAAVRIDPNTL